MAGLRILTHFSAFGTTVCTQSVTPHHIYSDTFVRVDYEKTEPVASSDRPLGGVQIKKIVQKRSPPRRRAPIRARDKVDTYAAGAGRRGQGRTGRPAGHRPGARMRFVSGVWCGVARRAGSLCRGARARECTAPRIRAPVHKCQPCPGAGRRPAPAGDRDFQAISRLP